jgi:MFS family permease
MAPGSFELPRGFAGYVALLKQNSDVRNVWLAQVVSQLGDWFSSVALLGLINQVSRDPLAPTLVTVFTVLPSAVAGLTISGIIADRFDRKKLAITMDLVRAAIALVMLLVNSAETLWIVYAAIIALALCESVFTPAVSAAQPNLCKPHELATANALQQSTWASMSLVGVFLGGLVATYFGREWAFIVNAFSFVGSAYFLLRVRGTFSSDKKMLGAASTLRALTAGFHWLWHHPVVLMFSLAKSIWAFAFAAVGLFSVFSYQVYGTGDIGTSWLYAARGIGATLGPVVAQSLFPPQTQKQTALLIGVAFVFCVVGYGLWGVSGAPFLGALGILIGHLGGGNVWTYSRILVQSEAPDHLRGRIMALDFVGFMLITGAFAFVLGAVARGASPMWGVLTGVALTAFFALGWCAWMWRQFRNE